MSPQRDENSVYRILDAGINRAGEGLRVVEDYLRLVLDDAHLALHLKDLRHDLTEAVAGIDTSRRIAARDSESDVGRHLQTDSEYVRGIDDSLERQDTTQPNRPVSEFSSSDPATSVVQANLARVQQSFRSIEEFSKIFDAELSKNIEQLRYRTYTLEKAILTTILSLANLGEAHLYVLIDAGEQFRQTGDPIEILNRVEQLIEAGVDFIQLREKNLTDRQLVELGRLISGITNNRPVRFIMNDRVDLALACRADGVHVGQDELSVPDARKMLGATRLIGVSTHSIEQARQAVLDGANYIGVGPVFPSTTKSFEKYVGTDLLKQIAAEIQLPAFAIGGIDVANVAEVLSTGIHRVAVGGAVTAAQEPARVLAELRQLLEVR